ncbi:MAG TPA: peptidyl-prolyl cis-trans isomerase [Pyrinomonadaceae bacterium]|nr:peptidyl-prolyl cis-trans isomerase [Pyrinomonadaceae bacterium]
MKSKFIFATLMLLASLSFGSSTALAQEGELKVVDEVIAQVNEDVITLSMVRRESKERVLALKQGGMPEQQAIEEVAKRQADLIATLINEQLLMQKGKELDLASEVEAEVNRRMLDVAREQGITSIEKLDEAMRESGLDPVATRQSLRTEMMKQAVIQQEVDRRTYLGLSMDELKKYFEANRAKFTKPESVVLSEIFLTYAGKNEADVKARAMELVTQLRSGADFGALAAANSEREMNGVRVAPQNKGKVGRFEILNLREEIAKQIKGVKVGGISEPLKINDGYQILRVDEREDASSAAVFNENQVREAMTIERSPKEREAYLRNLLNDSYVKISDSYRESVEPLLKLKPADAAKADESTTGKNADKNKKP